MSPTNFACNRRKTAPGLHLRMGLIGAVKAKGLAANLLAARKKAASSLASLSNKSLDLARSGPRTMFWGPLLRIKAAAAANSVRQRKYD